MFVEVVEVLISEMEIVRIEENARGIRRPELLIRALAAAPIATGRKAVAAELVMKAESTAVATMIAMTSRVGCLPATLRMKRPALSTTPVRSKAAVMINSTRINRSASRLTVE
jgi:hypothetical protein